MFLSSILEKFSAGFGREFLFWEERGMVVFFFVI